jgi:hypothetical protein
MTTTTISCDRCNAKIAADRARLLLDVGPVPPGWPTDPATLKPSLDLCKLCLDALAGWLAAGRAPGRRGDGSPEP